jgi:hypothetical protein
MSILSDNKHCVHLEELSNIQETESYQNITDPSISIAGLNATLNHIDTRISVLRNKLAEVIRAKEQICARITELESENGGRLPG